MAISWLVAMRNEFWWMTIVKGHFHWHRFHWKGGVCCFPNELFSEKLLQNIMLSTFNNFCTILLSFRRWKMWSQTGRILVNTLIKLVCTKCVYSSDFFLKEKKCYIQKTTWFKILDSPPKELGAIIVIFIFVLLEVISY